MIEREEINGRSNKCAPGRLRSLQSFQVLLLRHALLNFPSAKKVVYSTCSIHPEENEHVIDEILSDIGEAYTLKSPKEILEGNWINLSSLDFACKDNCLYARPEVDLTNGFFVAVFERNFDVPLPEYKRKSKINREGNSNFKNFNKEKSEGECKDNGDAENEENEERKGEENGFGRTEKTSERQLTASQKKRMRRRRKFNAQTSETFVKEVKEVKEESEVKEFENEEVKEIEDSKKRKHKKKKKKHQEDESPELGNLPQEVEVENIEQEEDSAKSEKKKKKRKHKESSDLISLSVETDIPETENPPAKKRKKKKKKKVADD